MQTERYISLFLMDEVRNADGTWHWGLDAFICKRWDTVQAHMALRRLGAASPTPPEYIELVSAHSGMDIRRQHNPRMYSDICVLHTGHRVRRTELAKTIASMSVTEVYDTFLRVKHNVGLHLSEGQPVLLATNG